MYWTPYQVEQCLTRAIKRGWSSDSYRNSGVTFKFMAEPPRHGFAWSVQERADLLAEAKRCTSIPDLAQRHGRSEEAIVQQLARLIEEDDLSQAEQAERAAQERAELLRQANQRAINLQDNTALLCKEDRRLRRLKGVRDIGQVYMYGLNKHMKADLTMLVARGLLQFERTLAPEGFIEVFTITEEGKQFVDMYEQLKTGE